MDSSLDQTLSTNRRRQKEAVACNGYRSVQSQPLMSCVDASGGAHCGTTQRSINDCPDSVPYIDFFSCFHCCLVSFCSSRYLTKY